MIGNPTRLIQFSVTKFQIGRPSIITDLADDAKPAAFSMEETHDVLYDRISLSESKYIIKTLIQQVKEKLVQKPKLKHIKPPSWVNNYQLILQDEYDLLDADDTIIF